MKGHKVAITNLAIGKGLQVTQFCNSNSFKVTSDLCNSENLKVNIAQLCNELQVCNFTIL